MSYNMRKKPFSMTRLAMLFCISCGLLSGCLWVVRVPVPLHEKFSDDGICTNRVYKSLLADIREQGNKDKDVNGVFPLTKMRCYATYCAFKGSDTTGLKGRDLYEVRMKNRYLWIPGILIWVGEPVDLLVDVIMIPWDI